MAQIRIWICADFIQLVLINTICRNRIIHPELKLIHCC